jgi:hypothetical protein
MLGRASTTVITPAVAGNTERILPPLVLYRRLLRAHRKYLPRGARQIGDGYVKAEFHRTKNVENPVQIIGFLTQWQVSLTAIELTIRIIAKRSRASTGRIQKLTLSCSKK